LLLGRETTETKGTEGEREGGDFTDNFNAKHWHHYFPQFQPLSYTLLKSSAEYHGKKNSHVFTIVGQFLKENTPIINPSIDFF
jgi:hypothetical protein